MKRILLSGIVIASALAFSAAQSRLSGPDPDDGAIALPPGFLVVADNLVVGRKAGNTAERLRGIVVAPNGNIYAKTRLGQILALRDTTGACHMPDGSGVAGLQAPLAGSSEVAGDPATLIKVVSCEANRFV